MIRLLVVLAIAQCTVAVTEPSLDEIINEIFGISESEDDSKVGLPGCNDLEGSGRGCQECYFCNHSLIQDSRIRGGHVELQLKDSSCATTQICCVQQQDLVNYRLSDACGINNPDGKPRKRRSAPRAVLQGEFPWRAWVYKKNSRTPLCAASFVHEDTMALLTLASCVQGLSAEGLEVAFVKAGQKAAVAKVVVHSGYKTGQETNNIAILKLRSLESTPAWASPACLPLTPPSHAASCITTSDRDIRLNTIIPLRTACTEAHEAPPDSLTCAVAPPKDYQPEKAAGLFCKEQHVTTPLYILHGLAISKQDDSVTTYVNVWHFTDWIKNQLGISH
ncbi:uncharacterized protein LOC125239899 isoform X2 [Leguminivora glycinivorella]|uniref:uncharacterized protein LOC125239899 isoform X2 n=1 Tax=Leguminivora glycinivorella TaxID=1035111 RepID=UPI0020104515|nr:uncharacterized protein LOC125239899 isoform X2 [Leguminivora glycinivorella]